MTTNGRVRRSLLAGNCTLAREPHKAGDGANDKLQLSAIDERHLKEFEKKLQLVRDRTTAVALGYANGFSLDGPGGVSKSFTVLQTLEALQANYRVSNSRMTGRGLFDTLDMYPDAIHVVEDT